MKEVKETAMKKLSGKELSNFIMRTFEERGKEALEIAQKVMLDEAEKLSNNEVREALKYFMNKYWRDIVRPALVSIACESLGGNPKVTIPISVPLILLGGAIDVHDDIIDKTKIKRASPTVYGKFGEDVAVLVGDALLFKGITLLYQASKEIEPEKVHAIFEVLKKFFFELGDAEANELNLKRNKVLKVKEYIDFVEKKAAELEAYMRISAILADAPKEQIDALGRYGRILGMLVILGDDNADVLNHRELINRIKNEVLPLPIIYALQEPNLRKKLIPILQKKRLTKKDADNILEIICAAKIFDALEEYFMNFIDDGYRILEKIPNNNLLIKVLESTYPKDYLNG